MFVDDAAQLFESIFVEKLGQLLLHFIAVHVLSPVMKLTASRGGRRGNRPA
jgi:hypothetical protein